MTATLFHLFGLALLGLWFRLRPRQRPRTLVGLWWSGLLLMRVLPNVVAPLLLGEDRAPVAPWIATGLAALAWIGSLLLLRALLGICLWDRPRDRKLRVFSGLFLLALVLSGFAHSNKFLLVALAYPMLWSFRWRFSLSAPQLLLVNLGSLVSLLLSGVTFGTIQVDPASIFPGLVRLPTLVPILSLSYAFLCMPASASRMHLSIRRIGMRLVGSHLLAGLIPVTLSVLFLLVGSALFLSTYRGTIGERMLSETSEQARIRITQALARRADVPLQPFGPERTGQVVLAREQDGPARVLAGTPPQEPDSLLAMDAPSPTTPLLWDDRTLYVRARVDTSLDGRDLRIEALAPVDSMTMVRVSGIVGVPVRVSPRVVIRRSAGGVSIATMDSPASKAPGDSVAKQTAGSIGPPPAARYQLPGGATVRCLRWTDGRWAESTIPISSSASFGEQLVSLFSKSKKNPIATLVLMALAVLAALFLGAIWVTSSMVLDMGRSITRSVRALTTAAHALGQGKLDHRIPVEGQDELWNVAASFNTMAEGLQKMRAMELQSQRLEEELRLARVIQDRLLPAAPPVFERVELAGLSLPAREVGGDYYDYLVLEGGLLGLAVADVSGKGAPAAILMSTFRASLRSQDLATLGPAEVLGRINRFIHSSIDPGRFITAFLGLLDPVTGEFRYANAGHDAPVVIAADGVVSELTGGGLILGLLPQIVYEEATARLDVGALVSIFTDGITEARSPSEEFYGTERLIEVLKRVRGEPCTEVLRSVVTAIQDFGAGGPQSDDVTLVVLRRR